jgi:hypothetical protein
MIEFVLKNRRLRLYPDGTITCRAIINGKETKNGVWNKVTFFEIKGYSECSLTIDGKSRKFLQHRLIYLACNPSWDIFDTSKDNCIDHINRIKTDNSIDNLRLVSQQENTFNTNAKGYSLDKKTKKWMTRIMVNNKSSLLGYFDKEEDAHAAYLKAKERLHVIPEN